jgi:NADPH2:quinone reductase
VLATASSDARLERLKPLGLDHGINYRTDDVVKSVMKITNNRGVDLVVDPVGGATLQGSLLSLAYRGRVSMVGAAGREPMTVDVSPLMAGNRSLTGVFLGAEIGTERAHNMIQRLIEEIARGEYTVVIDRTFPLSEAGAAHAYIESRQAVGRVLLIP